MLFCGAPRSHHRLPFRGHPNSRPELRGRAAKTPSRWGRWCHKSVVGFFGRRIRKSRRKLTSSPRPRRTEVVRDEPPARLAFQVSVEASYLKYSSAQATKIKAHLAPTKPQASETAARNRAR